MRQHDASSYYNPFRPAIACVSDKVCATLPAGNGIDVFLVDEAGLLDASALLVAKLGFNESVTLPAPDQIDDAHYHFRYTTRPIGLQLIDIQQLDGTVFRLILESTDYDCNQLSASGTCRCSPGQYLIDGLCQSYSRVAGMCIVPIFFVAVAGYLFTTNGYKTEDAVWKIKPTQLLFNKPPELLGRVSIHLSLNQHVVATISRCASGLPGNCCQRPTSQYSRCCQTGKLFCSSPAFKRNNDGDADDPTQRTRWKF